MASNAQPVSIKINGEQHVLRLTLGALAQIEDALGGDVSELKTRLARPRVRDLLIILHALLAGGGAGLTLAALEASDINLTDAAEAIAKAFQSLGEETAPGKAMTGAAPTVEKSSATAD